MVAPGALGSIPFTAISCCADRLGIDDADEFHAFKALIRAMDRIYLEHRRPRPAQGKR